MITHYREKGVLPVSYPKLTKAVCGAKVVYVSTAYSQYRSNSTNDKRKVTCKTCLRVLSRGSQ
jgi:hypothetical protein